MTEEIDILSREKLTTLNKHWPEWRFRCSDWEKEFIADLLTRYRTYGPGMRLSAKQRNCLAEIHDKIKD